MNKLLIAQTVAKHSRYLMPGYMTGPYNKPRRAEIIEACTGVKPKSSACGITTMMEFLYAAFPAPRAATCMADRETMLTESISETLNSIK